MSAKSPRGGEQTHSQPSVYHAKPIVISPYGNKSLYILSMSTIHFISVTRITQIFWYLSQFQEMKAHVSLCKCVDSPQHLLPAYTKYRCRPELRPLATLRQHGKLMLAFANM